MPVIEDLWGFLPEDDDSRDDLDAAERTRLPAEIAALHVFVPGGPLLLEPGHAEPAMARFFADEDPGRPRPARDEAEDLGERLARQRLP